MQIERAQFEKLALEQLDMLYRIARRLTGNDAAAQDLVQETYLRALGARENFDLREFGIRPWLLRILHNLHSSRRQRENRQPRALDDRQLEQMGGAAPAPPFLAEGFDGMDQRLVGAFDRLPTEYQSVMMLWALEEMTYAEIAQALEIPIGTVMSRLHRARQRLYAQLHDYAAREGIIRE
jgi:RNA polymerase sigma-70 factor (ECF subfamily)